MDGGFRTFAASASQPPGKDGSGHSVRVIIEDSSAIQHGGCEPTLINAAMSIKDREMLFADIQRSRG